MKTLDCMNSEGKNTLSDQNEFCIETCFNACSVVFDGSFDNCKITYIQHNF